MKFFINFEKNICLRHGKVYLLIDMIRFAVAIFLVLILPRLWTFGMFLDGLLYASISRNMAEGVGMFNAPYYSDSLGKVFYWHPPLSMWLHSLFYRLFGDHLLIDSLFGFISGSIILFLLILIYRVSDSENQNKSGSSYWSVILLISLMPMTSWIFSNNMLEVTMTMFLLASAYLQLRAIYYKPGVLALYYFLAGGFLALAVLSKNVAGLFPLIIPMLHFIIFRKISLRKAFLLGIFTTIAMVFWTCAILYLSDSIELYKNYIQHQLVPSVAGTMPGEDTGFLRNVRLIVSELAIPLLLSGLVMLVFKKWTEVRITRLGLFFLILGLSGTLPLFLIHKFRSYYLFPGLPFFALFIAASFSTVYSELEKKYLESGKFRLYTNLSSVAIIAAAVILFIAGRNYPVRLKEFKHDVYDSSLKIPERSIITDCSGGVDYTLIAAFQRYNKLSLLRQSNLDQSKWILEDKHKACDIPKNCKKINREDAIKYNIYECSFVKTNSSP